MKGALENASTGLKLVMLILLALIGAIFFTVIGVFVAKSVYDLSFEGIVEVIENLTNVGNTGVFKMVQGFSTVGMFLFPALVSAYLFSKQPERFLKIDHFPKPVWLIVILVGVLSYSSGVVSDLLYRLSMAVEFPEFLASFQQSLLDGQEAATAQYQSILQMENFNNFLQVFMVMAILPAIAEEALFRGAFQPIMIKSLGKHLGIILTAIAFALLHQQVYAFLSILALGIVLGYLKEWSNSLWVPTLMHLINNGAIVVMVYFFDIPYDQAIEGSFFDDWLLTAVLGAVFVVALLLIYKILQQKKVTD